VGILILARDRRPAATIKERLDRRLGLSHIVPFVDPDAAARAVAELEPSSVVIVSDRLDPIVLKACEWLGAQATPSQAPFIAAAGVASDPDRIAALNAGARDPTPGCRRDRTMGACELTTNTRPRCDSRA
jgi:hypothetical protein